MWTYCQSTGNLYLNGILEGSGYSGHGIGYNNSNTESMKGIGPLPATLYTIGQFEDLPHLGPCVAPLAPVNLDTVFGRSGFFIHGDNKFMNHSASDGCIILELSLREAVRDSKVTKLLVVNSDAE